MSKVKMHKSNIKKEEELKRKAVESDLKTKSHGARSSFGYHRFVYNNLEWVLKQD
jgi:hypothetical protein